MKPAERGHVKSGRTLWDIVSLLLFNKIVLTIITTLVLLFLGFSAFDLVSFRYDDGPKLRIGRDFAALQRQDEILKQQKQAQQAAESERKMDLQRNAAYGDLRGIWYASVDVKPDLKESLLFTNNDCDLAFSYQIDQIKYNEVSKTGGLTLSILGNSSSCNLQLYRDIKLDRIKAWRFALRWDWTELRTVDRGYTNNFYSDSPSEGEPIVIGITFDGSIEFDEESSTHFRSHLIQKECSKSCIESNATFEITPSGALVYRGPNFFDATAIALYMKKYQPPGGDKK